jgi:hypothetical protein
VAVDWKQLESAMNQKILDCLEREIGDGTLILRLAEARAWIINPGQDHGASSYG